MRTALIAALTSLIAPVASAASLPIDGAYCAETVRLDGNELAFEDGSCPHSKVRTLGPHEWQVADCSTEGAVLVIKISPDKKTATIKFTDDPEPLILQPCETP